MTIAAIHQPQYLPWLPYFDKADQADVFVHLDNVGYHFGGVQNRNQIKTPQGPLWLTVPIAGSRRQKIYDLMIADERWSERHIRAIELNYARAEHFAALAAPLKEILQRRWERLVDLNITTTEWMFQALAIGCKTVRASQLDVAGEKEEVVIAICRAVGATEYLSGVGAADYQNAAVFHAQGLKLRYQSYQPVEYPQCWPHAGFLPHLSAVDLLFNAGPRSRDIMLQGRR